MRADDITRALDSVGKSWTRQIKAEEKHTSARSYRETMYTVARVALKEICYEHMQEAWDKASDNSRLPTHWRQIFYVMRPICNADPDSDRPLRDATFKQILESYLAEFAPGWDVLRGARGVFKEPHSAEDDSGLPMSTMGVRSYLHAARQEQDPRIHPLDAHFPTKGAKNRIAAILICEKEGFDELLQAEEIPARYDLALMSTKGISAIAARDLAENLGVPCFTLHDLDKNGFLMAAGFAFATDIGIKIADVEEWDLAPEEQYHRNPRRTRETLLRNGASEDEADFIAGGQRVELNMFTGPDFIEFVERKLDAHGVKKIVPDDDTLAAAWQRAHLTLRVNQLIEGIYAAADEPPRDLAREIPPIPVNLAARIREELDDDPTQSWDEALWGIAGGENDPAAPHPAGARPGGGS